jgi:nucleoside-diphosphate-sugar epimerase
MKVLLAGATGAIGRQLVPLLAGRDHEVTAMVRSESKIDSVAAVGANAVVADALDREAVLVAAVESAPEVVAHELTAISLHQVAPDGSDAELVREQQFPIAGGGPAFWSFIHVHDAATATVRAIEHGEAGIYNIVDDEPAARAEWLPVYARALGAPAPPQTGPPRVRRHERREHVDRTLSLCRVCAWRT